MRSVRFSAAPDKNRIKYGNYIRLYPKSGNDLANRPCAQAALPLRCESRRFLWIAEIKNRPVIFQSGRTPGRPPRVCEGCGPPVGRRPARPLMRKLSFNRRFNVLSFADERLFFFVRSCRGGTGFSRRLMPAGHLLFCTTKKGDKKVAGNAIPRS